MNAPCRYNPLLEARIELFKRKNFEFITDRDGKSHKKQNDCFQLLTDDVHTDVVYGGAAGGAKSWTGCTYLAFMSLLYPGTKWFVGRETLVDLMTSTWQTFGRVFKQYGIDKDYYKINEKYNFIEFINGSRIDFLKLQFLPKDPLYERFGSKEYTGGWIEEAGQINLGAYDILKTRINRWMNDKYNLIGKIFITCNPKKNWLYNKFYKPYIKKLLPPHVAFLQCLVTENPFIDSGYIKNLQTSNNKVLIERLLKANWDYEDNPNAMCAHDTILQIFNNILSVKNGKYYIVCDVARFGSDVARITVWNGYVLIYQNQFDTSKLTAIQMNIKHLQQKYKIPNYRVLVDEDGVGGGVVDNCDVIGFKNNSKPFNEENYKNLKTQCAYKLAEKINNNEIGFEAEISESEKENIILELGNLQTWNVDGDGKLEVKPKEEIKDTIGHSPDWLDCFTMRMYFEYMDTGGFENITKDTFGFH